MLETENRFSAATYISQVIGTFWIGLLKPVRADCGLLRH